MQHRNLYIYYVEVVTREICIFYMTQKYNYLLGIHFRKYFL